MMKPSNYKRGINRRIVFLIIYFALLLALAILSIYARSRSDLKLRLPENKPLKTEVSLTSYTPSPFEHKKVSYYDGDSEISEGCNGPIHIALVCGGFNSTRNFYVLLKSILFYRTNEIHLHLFVDNISQLILKELFSNWPVQDLTIKFYNITNHEREVSWIAGQHYSHRYGLMKLVVLPVLYDSNLTRVIILDTDTLCLGNINRLWRLFDDMNKTIEGEKPIFGMVENQSDWYLGNERNGNRNVWPAIGRGFNSGVMLVNLVEMERQNWSGIWRQVAELELTSHLSTSLADQDVLNAVIKSHPSMVYELPCSFNIQLNDHSKLGIQCNGRLNFKILHWNSPYKFAIRNSVAQVYTNWYNTFINWNGKLLERSFCNQDDQTQDKLVTQNHSALDSLCKDIKPRPEDKLRTFLYFNEFHWVPSKWDVSLVVHLSIDRLLVLDQLAAHWSGPISAAIYLDELETNLLQLSIQNSNSLVQRKNIGYHLVFKDHGFSYPINRLRNVALSNAISSYVFLSDIDFLPSTNLYEYLKQTLFDMANSNQEDKPLEREVLVIPAFENVQYRFEFPGSKADLLTQLNLGSVSMFRDQIWPKGHAPTNYAKWRASTKPYKVDWKPEYEPFIVASKTVPKYDERFVGFGWNKVENIMHLAALNYEFIVLPEAFVIHNFHSASYDIMKHRESSKYRSCIKQLKRTTLSEMSVRFPEFFKRLSETSPTVTTHLKH